VWRVFDAPCPASFVGLRAKGTVRVFFRCGVSTKGALEDGIVPMPARMRVTNGVALGLSLSYRIDLL
jgi:hypothetical protein